MADNDYTEEALEAARRREAYYSAQSVEEIEKLDEQLAGDEDQEADAPQDGVDPNKPSERFGF